MSINYITHQCPKCKGSGLIKKDQFICESCNKGNFTICTLCEKIQFRGKYEECNTCFGRGEIFFDKKTKHKTFKPLSVSQQKKI